ncbi:MAG: hypothetical protein NTY07_00805 [Bacteroidia bacterium]|nr:hypothetical protein [Bacteroidia bacterium]
MPKKFLAEIFFLTTILFLWGQLVTSAQTGKGKSNETPVFCGDNIVYQGKKIALGTKAFYIDGQLSDQEAAKYSFVYNSVNEAAKHLTDGTEESPMVLYIAPYVYWIDNPDDPAIRLPKSGGTPFGLEIKCEWLKFFGLSDDARNVVLACNRGQTMGAKGNFTMFNISGQGTSAENITFGNYCNIDLEYPLKPELGRVKRGSAIVQAQLVFCDGDKLVARNARFVSRLNLCPFFGIKRTLFDHCHFECTDDALNPTAVYLNCTFDFYSGKPFGGTFATGAIILNCDIRSFTRGEQYFTKMGGQVAALDTRFVSETATYLGWRDFPAKESRHYQYNIQMNGKPVVIGTHHLQSTVDMNGKAVLDAYRLVYKDKVIYNTYNLLRGDDDWDPMGIKSMILAAEKESGKSFTNLATQLLISPTQRTIETGKESVVLRAKVNKFGNYELKGEKITWTLASEYESLIDLKINDDGTCEVIPTNENDETKEVIIKASTQTGLESASVLYISPSVLEAPKFSSPPKITKSVAGMLSVDYKLNMRFKDQSQVSWYRCSDIKGSNPIEIAVSRFNEPKLEYRLSAGDIGYYILVKVMPKHLRCQAGKAVEAITGGPVSVKDVKADNKILKVDLRSLSTKYQPEVKPGFWTLDCYAPADTKEQDWTADNSRDPWYFGAGEDGAAKDTGLVQANKGARVRYTPVGNEFGDMKISFTAVPSKTAGQGFSSARAQYMDVFIKFDTETLNGYALRLIRTTKYGDAIDFVLMKYENGIAVAISKPVSATCYRPNCYITIEVKGNKLIVHAESPAAYYIVPDRPEVVQVVDMETEISPNKFGGIGFQHTGTVRGGATLIKDLKIEWK